MLGGITRTHAHTPHAHARTHAHALSLASLARDSERYNSRAKYKVLREHGITHARTRAHVNVPTRIQTNVHNLTGKWVSATITRVELEEEELDSEEDQEERELQRAQENEAVRRMEMRARNAMRREPGGNSINPH